MFFGFPLNFEICFEWLHLHIFKITEFEIEKFILDK